MINYYSLTVPIRQYPRPGHRKPVVLHVELLQHLDVSPPLVVRISCHIGVAVVEDTLWVLVCVAVPDALAFV